MGAAAADISLERLHDVGFAGILIFLQECDAANNHSGGAIGALECALVEKCLLYRMKLTVLFETFNREDGFSGSVADRELAGAAGRAVEQDRSEERRVGKLCDWSSDVCSSDLDFDFFAGVRRC